MIDMDDLEGPVKVYHIPFTQFMRPDGRKVPQNFATEDRDLYMTANRLRDKGMWFEAEVLTTGHASFTVMQDDEDNPQVDIEVVMNGPGVPDAVKRLFDRVTKRLEEESACHSVPLMVL